MRYREDERDQYVPERPCPECGRLDGLEVDWVDVTSFEEYARGERFAVPGVLHCTNHEPSNAG